MVQYLLVIIFVINVDNRQCVRPDHLFLGMAVDNIRDALQKGRMKTGEAHHNTKLTWPAAHTIRWLYKAGVTKESLARMFNVSTRLIQLVYENKVWIPKETASVE